jgi:hypothetical protein
MRFGSHIPIPRNFHSAPQRLPRPFLLLNAGASSHSPNRIPVAAWPYSRLYNSTLVSTPTTSANVDSDVIIQRVPSKDSQLTPNLEYKKLVDAGSLRSDDYQTQIVQKLQALHDALALYDPPPPAGPPSIVNTSPFPFAPYPIYTSYASSSHAFSPAPHRALRAPTDQRDCISMVTSGRERLCSWTSSTTHSPRASPTSDACTSTRSCSMSINGCMRPRLPAQAIRFYPSHETLQTRRTYYA